jgi:hypothetical protein
MGYGLWAKIAGGSLVCVRGMGYGARENYSRRPSSAARPHPFLRISQRDVVGAVMSSSAASCISLGSAIELEYHPLLSHEIGLIKPAVYEGLSSQVIRLQRMLAGLYRVLKRPQLRGQVTAHSPQPIAHSPQPIAYPGLATRIPVDRRIAATYSGRVVRVISTTPPESGAWSTRRIPSLSR